MTTLSHQTIIYGILWYSNLDKSKEILSFMVEGGTRFFHQSHLSEGHNHPWQHVFQGAVIPHQHMFFFVCLSESKEHNGNKFPSTTKDDITSCMTLHPIPSCDVMSLTVIHHSPLIRT